MIRLDTSQRGIFSETLTFTTSGSNAGGFSGTIRGGGARVERVRVRVRER